MHIGKIYTYGNIVSHKDVVSYYYKVRPINSLFASETQKTILLEKFTNLILDVNMPGFFIIKPRELDKRKIYKAYGDSYNRYGRPECLDLAKDYIGSIKEILHKAIKYRYEIYFVFCDGREEMKKRKNISLIPIENKGLTKSEIEMYSVVEEEIFKQVSKHLDADKVEDEKHLVRFHNYLSIPVEKNIEEHYVTPEPAHLKYEYLVSGNPGWKELYTTTMVASSYKKTSIKNDKVADDVFNSLQLETYPTDIIVKFDLVHTKEFVKHMSSQKETITKSARRYKSLTDRNDKEAIKSRVVATAAENADELIENSKIRWQLYIRLRANSVEMLERRRETIRTKFKSRMALSVEVGNQILLADNLLPYRNEFRKYIQPTDISYLAQYNFLGGIYIGEEEEGIIETFTKPGELPVFYNSTRILEGKVKTNAPTTAYAGVTGGGKTQLCDHRCFVNMIFKGRRELTIDPKGDRQKKIAMLGDLASHLEIGAKDNPDGMLDCFLMNSDEKVALAEAKENISSLARALNQNMQIDFYSIGKAFGDMKKDLRTHKVKQLTFTTLIEKYMEYDEYVAKQVLSVKDDPIGRLFFADQDTRIDQAFGLNKPYNLITFKEVPVYSEDKKDVNFNPTQIKHAIFAVVLSKVTGIVNGFMRKFGEEEKEVTFDEYRVWKTVPGGEAVVINTVVTARTFKTLVNIISQQVSDINPEILNNLGQMFVGSLSSMDEIDFALKQMKLDDHEVVKGALVDRVNDEGEDENKKYVFLFMDYNNRKSLTRLIMPRTFREAFTTHKKADDEMDQVTKQQSKSSEELLWET